MTVRRTDLTEQEFRGALAREVRALLLGEKSSAQVEDWLRSVRIDNEPIDDLRIRTGLTGLRLLMFGIRAPKQIRADAQKTPKGGRRGKA